MPSTARIDRLRRRVQRRISYCDTCQPYDEGVVWIHGDRISLDALLDEEDVPEDDREEVSELLNCPSCGRDQLDRWDDVGEKDESEKQADARWAKWYTKYEGAVEEFGNFLGKYPYLGATHKIGANIHRLIKDFPKTSIDEEQVWWRARKPEGAKQFTQKDLLPPPTRDAKSEGRFNHYGQSVFYLASSANEALLETLNVRQKECFAWVQQYKIAPIQDLIDLTQCWHRDDARFPVLALGLINQRLPHLNPVKESPWKPEYFIPRYIADCAKANGFRGIVFESQKHYARNLVLFNWDKSIVKPKGKPTLQTVTRSRGLGFGDRSISSDDF